MPNVKREKWEEIQRQLKEKDAEISKLKEDMKGDAAATETLRSLIAEYNMKYGTEIREIADMNPWTVRQAVSEFINEEREYAEKERDRCSRMKQQLEEARAELAAAVQPLKDKIVELVMEKGKGL